MINAINNQSTGPDFSNMQITDKSLQIRSSENFSNKDIENISQFSKNLYKSKLDLKASSVDQNGDQFKFNLAFSSKSLEKLTADGSLDTEEKKLNVTLKYDFKKEVNINGKIKVKAFEAIIDIKAHISKYAAQKSTGENSDVINFVRRVIQEITKVSGDDWTELRRASFDKDDLKNMLSLQDSKISDMVKNLITLALSVAQMQKIKKEDKESESNLYKTDEAKKEKEIFPEEFDDIASFDVRIKEKDTEEESNLDSEE